MATKTRTTVYKRPRPLLVWLSLDKVHYVYVGQALQVPSEADPFCLVFDDSSACQRVYIKITKHDELPKEVTCRAWTIPVDCHLYITDVGEISHD